ncbi:MAG: hypothetical protein J6O49_06265, partial [Bacteroidaceae bacterium]|nr:hypothetical protein [Bacteroidaceae bacterium]
PAYGATTTNNPRPRYIVLDIPEKIQVTNAEIHNEYSYLVNLAVEEAHYDIKKIVELIGKIEYRFLTI